MKGFCGTFFACNRAVNAVAPAPVEVVPAVRAPVPMAEARRRGVGVIDYTDLPPNAHNGTLAFPLRRQEPLEASRGPVDVTEAAPRELEAGAVAQMPPLSRLERFRASAQQVGASIALWNEQRRLAAEQRRADAARERRALNRQRRECQRRKSAMQEALGFARQANTDSRASNTQASSTPAP
ncbi:MAG: hypothetical protein K0R66_1738 [Gammaproteobacteria bacterium]|jgi:hypothetical protein|nr:hypothetical protein [Gammaproteobacteria bacterium]MDF2941096.1 hypothetical protein [Gammaproteobacteria bacterium]